MSCPHCNDRGSYVVAAIFDPHLVADEGGVSQLRTSYTIPIPAPCVCIAERAANQAPLRT